MGNISSKKNEGGAARLGGTSDDQLDSAMCVGAYSFVWEDDDAFQADDCLKGISFVDDDFDDTKVTNISLGSSGYASSENDDEESGKPLISNQRPKPKGGALGKSNRSREEILRR